MSDETSEFDLDTHFSDFGFLSDSPLQNVERVDILLYDADLHLDQKFVDLALANTKSRDRAKKSCARLSVSGVMP